MTPPRALRHALTVYRDARSITVHESWTQAVTDTRHTDNTLNLNNERRSQ